MDIEERIRQQEEFERTRGCHHWLLKSGKQVEIFDNPPLILLQMECEYYLENMTVSELDRVLGGLDKIAGVFDEELEKGGEFSEISGCYIFPLLEHFQTFYGAFKDKDLIPKADEIPLAIKIQAVCRRFKGLTRNHLMAAAYRRLIEGYPLAVGNPEKLLVLVSELSGLMALASNLDIAANGTLSFQHLNERAVSIHTRKQAEKAQQVRGKRKRAAQLAFLEAKTRKPSLSARQFSMEHFEKYGYTSYESLNYVLTGREIKKLREELNKLDI